MKIKTEIQNRKRKNILYKKRNEGSPASRPDPAQHRSPSSFPPPNRFAMKLTPSDADCLDPLFLSLSLSTRPHPSVLHPHPLRRPRLPRRPFLAKISRVNSLHCHCKTRPRPVILKRLPLLSH